MNLPIDAKLEKLAIGILLFPSDGDIPIALRVQEQYRNPNELFATWGGKILWQAITNSKSLNSDIVRREIIKLRHSKEFMFDGEVRDLSKDWEPDILSGRVSWSDLSNWQEYFDKLHKLRIARSALNLIDKCENKLSVGEGVDDAIADLYSGLQGIAMEESSIKDPSARAAVLEALEEWNDTVPLEERFVKTGLPIDADIYGFDISDGELVGIAGAEKSGKSRLAIHIIRSIINRGVRSVYLTLETGMARKAVIWRFMAQELAQMARDNGLSSVPAMSDRDLRFHGFTGSVFDDFIPSLTARAEEWPLSIYTSRPAEGRTRSLSSIATIIEREARFFNAKVFVVDPIQVAGDNQRIFDRMEAITTTLGNLSLALGVCIIGISHQSMEYQRNFKDRADIIETKGGGGFTGEANLLFEINKGSTEREIVLNLKAARYAGSSKYKLFIEPNTGLVIGSERVV